MERQPVERVIYDDDAYWDDPYYDEGNEDPDSLMSFYKEAVEVTGEGFQSYVDDVRYEDYKSEVAALSSFFAGKGSDQSSFENPLGGNTILASGSIGRWDGTRAGCSDFPTFEDVLSGPDSPFKDCEIRKIWDENGHLYVHGVHHDGSVTVELRQLTDAGMEALEAMRDVWFGQPFVAAHRHYDGSKGSMREFFNDLVADPSLCPVPRYMEQCFGCKAEEWAEPEPQRVEQAPSLSSAAKESRAAAEALSQDDTRDAPGRDDQSR